MKPEELVRLATAIFGTGWRKPLAREVGRSPKMMRVYERGETPIPETIADRLRSIADLGPEGETVKATVLRHLPRTKPRVAHTIAADAADKIKAGRPQKAKASRRKN